MKKMTPYEMINAHIHLNLGVYFDRYDPGNDFCVATSLRIKDYYWNFAFRNDGQSFDDSALEKVEKTLSSLDRGPAVYLLAAEPIPPGWSVQDEEAWMIVGPDSLKSSADDRAGEQLQFRELDRPLSEMREVFEDAYSSETTDDDIGYFRLPPEYGDVYEHSALRPPATLCHLGGWWDGKCVTVATIAVWNGIGGVYSVATAHKSRRHGFGKAISRYATKWAFRNGATAVLLQTAANSEVERMYQTLGFCRTHLGAFVTPLGTQC